MNTYGHTLSRQDARPCSVGHEPRGLHRLLRFHPEQFHVEENLQVGLRLGVAAGCAERHNPLALANRQCRVRRQARSLATFYGGCMARSRPRLGTERRKPNTSAGDDETRSSQWKGEGRPSDEIKAGT